MYLKLEIGYSHHLIPFPTIPKRRREASTDELSYPYLFVILLGILILIGSYYIQEKQDHPALGLLKKLTEELGIVLISVWGVSLFYEKFLAERHFRRFLQNLTELIHRGEMNAAVCENLGILEIHRGRRSYEEKHSFAAEAKNIAAGDTVRVTGRSLIFSMYTWRNLAQIVENGGHLQLCIVDPQLRDSPLNYLSGYSPEETELAIHRFVKRLKPWLEYHKPKGTLEVRFHRVHVLDSFMEISKSNHSFAAWDLNFGEGTEDRRIFFLNGDGPLARNLADGRYQLIWDNADVTFIYEDGAVSLDSLQGFAGGTAAATAPVSGAGESK